MWQDSLKPALWRWMVGTLIVDYLLQVNPDVDLDDDVIEHAETYLIH